VGATGATGIGATGATGPTGPTGLYVTSASISSGNLLITLSNSQVINAGYTLGATGVGATGPTGPNGLQARSVITYTTGTIANAASANVDITGYKGYNLYKIGVNGNAWVRLYTSSSARTTDYSRTQGSDPTPDTGVIAEVITTSSGNVTLSPAVLGFNDESPVTNVIPVAITNNTGSSTAFTITLTLVQTEA
jgi:hypothetical protein